MAAANTSPMLLRAFFALELTGAVGMTVILCTAVLSRDVKRLSTWYTFCASWILSCVSYCLLFIAGVQTGPEPGRSLCATQAALVYSVPTLTACTTLVLLIHGWYNVHFASEDPLEMNPTIMLVFKTFPFCVWFLMFISLLLSGLSDSSSTIRYQFYCVYTERLPSKISSLLVIITTFSMVPIQASLGISLCNILCFSHCTTTSIQTIKVVFRAMIFSLLTLVAFVEGVIHLFSDYPSPAVTIIMATLPVSGVLIFGIQRDIFRAWIFWKRFDRAPTLPLALPDPDSKGTGQYSRTAKPLPTIPRSPSSRESM